MITAHTSSRIEVATKLCDAKNIMLNMRSYICLNESDIKKIDDMVLDIDSIVNKVMGVGK